MTDTLKRHIAALAFDGFKYRPSNMQVSLNSNEASLTVVVETPDELKKRRLFKVEVKEI